MPRTDSAQHTDLTRSLQHGESHRRGEREAPHENHHPTHHAEKRDDHQQMIVDAALRLRQHGTGAYDVPTLAERGSQAGDQIQLQCLAPIHALHDQGRTAVGTSTAHRAAHVFTRGVRRHAWTATDHANDLPRLRGTIHEQWHVHSHTETWLAALQGASDHHCAPVIGPEPSSRLHGGLKQPGGSRWCRDHEAIAARAIAVVEHGRHGVPCFDARNALNRSRNRFKRVSVSRRDQPQGEVVPIRCKDRVGDVEHGGAQVVRAKVGGAAQRQRAQREQGALWSAQTIAQREQHRPWQAAYLQRALAEPGV